MNRLWFFFVLMIIAAGINTLIAGICSSLPYPVEFDAKYTADLRRQHWEHLDATGDNEADSQWILGAYVAFGRELRVIRPHIDEPVMVFEHYSGWPFRAFKGSERVANPPPSTVGFFSENRNLKFAIKINDTLKIVAPTWSSAPARPSRKLRIQGQAPSPTQSSAPAGNTSIIMKTYSMKPHPAQVIPVLPRGRGFILNTLFYMLLFIMASGLWMYTKGMYYYFRGCCFRCGYELRLGPPDRAACPECGRAVKPDSVSPGGS